MLHWVKMRRKYRKRTETTRNIGAGVVEGGRGRSWRKEGKHNDDSTIVSENKNKKMKKRWKGTVSYINRPSRSTLAAEEDIKGLE